MVFCPRVAGWLPFVMANEIVGFTGEMMGDGRLVITRVFDGGPAELAGIHIGDIVERQANQDVAQWHQYFVSDRRAYVEGRSEWRKKPVLFEVVRDGQPISFFLIPRPLRAIEIIHFYGVRLVVVALMIGLVVFVVASKPRDPVAYFACTCMCVMGLWLLTDSTYAQMFGSPLLLEASFEKFLRRETLAIVSLQLGLSMILHFVLVFPERAPPLHRYPQLILIAYVIPMLIILWFPISLHGNTTQRLDTFYRHRLWLDSGLLLLIAASAVRSYRTRASPTQREQMRWLVAAMGLTALAFVVLWNLPRLFMGTALVPHYDWVVAFMLLVPIAMTFAVANHQLFGVRGIIRRRIAVLEELLRREKAQVSYRDQRLQQLAQEIGHLQTDLAGYSALEHRAAPAGSGISEAVERLVDKHPALRSIQAERLLGVSPVWEDVFRQVLLASRGMTPVLIVGESGTGKTDLAWALSQLREPVDGPYKAVSCAQFEDADPAFSLGRLFGIGKDHGLPNVNKEGQPGMLEECDGGTLFLDDFDRLPLNIQDLFLYPFDGMPFEPGMGVGPARHVSVKFILAINQDPDRLLAAGGLRSDVMARVGTRIDVPPLRERKEDIPLLTEHFAAQVSRDLAHPISSISPKAMSLLAGYGYQKGNVRELKLEIRNAIGKALLEDDDVLRAGHVSDRITAVSAPESITSEETPEPERVASSMSAFSSPDDPPRMLEVLKKHRFHLKTAERELGLSHKSRTLSNHLRGICFKALSERGWSIEAAVRALAGERDPRTHEKLEGKIRRYLQSVDDNVTQGTERRLFNNLPASYFEPVREAIERSRSKGIR